MRFPLINKTILFFFLLVPFLLSANSLSEDVQVAKPKTVITLGFPWGHGYKNHVIEFQDRELENFVIETDEAIGLNYKQKILIDISSNSLPDIFSFLSYETNLKYLSKSGLIIESDEFFDLTDEIYKSEFSYESLKSTEIDGINYAIPHEEFLGVFAINRSIFERFNLDFPVYWSDFEKISPILNENGIIPFTMGSFRGDPGHLVLSALTYQHPDGFSDTQLMKESNNFIYPGTKQAADVILDLIRYKAIPKNTISEGSFDRQIEKFNREEAASIFLYSWNMALLDPEMAEKVVIIPVPRIDENSIDTSSFIIGGNSQNICISKKAWDNPDKREAIIKIVNWLFSEEVCKIRMNQSGFFPSRQIDIPKNNNPIFSKVFNYIEGKNVYGIHEFFFNSLSSFNNYKEANDLLWSGSLTSNEFLEMVQSGMDVNNE